MASDLKIAFIGDSISEQFAQAFDAASLGKGAERNRMAKTYRNGPGNINVHNCLSIAAPIRGGGINAFWRIANLMSMNNRATSPNVCVHKSRTWHERQALDLLGHRYSDHLKDSASAVSAFDAVVMRIPHGWMKIKEITKERIEEALLLSNQFLGAQTVIISTLPLNNNVVSVSDWLQIGRINQMVRNIAASWVPPRPGSVKWVLVQEFGNFTNQVVMMSAKHAKITDLSADFSQLEWELASSDFLFKRLPAETFWNPSKAMVCAEETHFRTTESGTSVEDCIRNKVSRDGTHWCVESIGPRYSASVACLLGCVYNGREPKNDSHDSKMVRLCEQACNDQFMSILPVSKKWIRAGNRIALFSKLI